MSCNTAEPEDYLIPNDYKGRVCIIFNRNQGAPTKYENGRRVYQIPDNGILLTQFKDEYGLIDHHYYHIDKSGKRTALKIYTYSYNPDGTTKWKIENAREIGIFFRWHNRRSRQHVFKAANKNHVTCARFLFDKLHSRANWEYPRN